MSRMNSQEEINEYKPNSRSERRRAKDTWRAKATNSPVPFTIRLTRDPRERSPARADQKRCNLKIMLFSKATLLHYWAANRRASFLISRHASSFPPPGPATGSIDKKDAAHGGLVQLPRPGLAPRKTSMASSSSGHRARPSAFRWRFHDTPHRCSLSKDHVSPCP
jgi:hypothetical protein